MPNRDVVVIGASAGGLEALQAVLAGVPADYGGVIAVVLHMAPGSGRSVAGILDRAGPMRVVEARDGQQLEPGRVYVCVPDRHLLLADSTGIVLVRRGPRENGHRPAADPLFRSAARYYGPRAVGVVLSGTLSDGTAGLQAIRRAGGTTIVQAPEDASFDGMPLSALEHVEVDHTLAAADIGPLLAKLAEVRVSGRGPAPDDDLVTEVAVMEHDDSVLDGANPGRPSEWPCPDCDGVLWEVPDGDVLRFRCRVGHAWSGESLLHEQEERVEAALWMALRSLEDRAALSRRMADRADAAGRAMSAARWRGDLGDMDECIAILRRMVQHEEVHESEG